ncbi:MAG: hypothetical protein HY290_08685 [Planctomycetia bacterium]|nr:hypothetical protein [Planctomycetia bacterium]
MSRIALAGSLIVLVSFAAAGSYIGFSNVSVEDSHAQFGPESCAVRAPAQLTTDSWKTARRPEKDAFQRILMQSQPDVCSSIDSTQGASLQSISARAPQSPFSLVLWQADATGASPFGLIPTEWTARPQLLPRTWKVQTVFASGGR